jgi:hypothetical protein
MSIDNCKSTGQHGPFTEIPDPYREKFMNLLELLEQETGKMYTLEVRIHGANHPLKFKPFNMRNKYIVSDMKAEFQDLEGEYRSGNEIESKIKELSKESSKWSHIRVDYHTGEIYKSGGGSVSICKTIGKLTII